MLHCPLNLISILVETRIEALNSPHTWTTFEIWGQIRKAALRGGSICRSVNVTRKRGEIALKYLTGISGARNQRCPISARQSGVMGSWADPFTLRSARPQKDRFIIQRLRLVAADRIIYDLCLGALSLAEIIRTNNRHNNIGRQN